MTEAQLDQLLDVAQRPENQPGGVWIGGLAVAAVALRRMDPFTRERVLRGVERELRDDLTGIAKLIEAQNHAAG
jgi:hypothetical protein